MSRQQADAFMRLAREPAVLDPRNWERLPRGWTVVDAIVRGARRSRQPVQALLDDGTVHRNMTRSQAQALAGGAASPAGRRVNAEWTSTGRIRVRRRRGAPPGGCPLADVKQALQLNVRRVLADYQRLCRFDSLDPEDRYWLLAVRAGLRRRPRALAPRTTAINSDGSTASPASGRPGGGPGGMELLIPLSDQRSERAKARSVARGGADI